MSLDAARAQRLVEARLGRPAQDALEAAVALEAWAGVPAQRALETARAMMPNRANAPLPSASSPATSARSPRPWLEGAAFLATVLAIALWAAPLAEALGAGAVERALRLALPLTLALQWGLLCRHLGRPSGLVGLASSGVSLSLGGLAVVVVPAMVLGPAGALAGLLTVTWTGGSILIRRGWAPVYCCIVAAAVPAMLAGLAADRVVAVVAAVVVVGVAGALRSAGTGTATPGRWSRTVGAGLTGAGIGALLVGDPSISWAAGAAPALALLPSAAGALWAGQHLWRLADAFPRALTGVPASGIALFRDTRAASPRGASQRDPGVATLLGAGVAHTRNTGAAPLGAGGVDPSDTGAAPPRGAGDAPGSHAPLDTLLGAVWRLVLVTVAGSVALLALTPWLAEDASRIGVLAGFGALALATLLVGLLDSLGRPSLAALGVAAGLAGEALARLDEPPFAGAALLVGGSFAVLVLLPAALALLARPARTLATALWIT